MPKYYVTGKIAQLDIGAEIEAETSYMAAIVFEKTYDPRLHFGTHQMLVSEVEEVADGKSY
ncbi:hypothetical protein ACYKKI_03640 [Streptococcus suis]|uniref:hypothetical protein n=1 Tax=Streptococcus TaxID=1301 RepID=UPI000943DFA3|nr:hypothetical protein [Streptococcus suis]MDW8739691.1 hypothetical protein [Streptococcus suis]HEL1905456.1 hypothetical protein [Streptococcus suis]HEL2244949.1 hypothetical protein [Streptococcus suis]HEL2598870.1 hypothetical protein [Streptococcus suis]HEL9619178.1 hypothetical protein [Streptococcus suis]